MILMNMTGLLKTLAWLLITTIVALSLVSPSLRPVTDAPQGVEHAAIFVLAGLACGLGYPQRPRVLLLLLVTFSAAVELAQLFAPGRHARLSDFVVDAIAACAGVALASLFGTATSRQA